MNSVNLIGRLTRDIDLNGGNTSVAKFTIAVTRPFKKDESDFINCVAFGKTAETMATYCRKGTMVGVSGRIQTGSYTNKEGNKVYTTDVVVDIFTFTNSFGQNNNNNNDNNNNNSSNNNNSNNNDDDIFGDITPVDDEDMPF